MSTIKTRGPANPTGAVRPLPLPSSRLQSSTGLFRITYCNYSPFFPTPHLAPTDESRCQRGIERSRQLSSDLRPSTDSRIVASCPEHNLGELAFCVYQYTPYAHRVRMNLFFSPGSLHIWNVCTLETGAWPFPPPASRLTWSPRPSRPDLCPSCSVSLPILLFSSRGNLWTRSSFGATLTARLYDSLSKTPR